MEQVDADKTSVFSSVPHKALPPLSSLHTLRLSSHNKRKPPAEDLPSVPHAAAMELCLPEHQHNLVLHCSWSNLGPNMWSSGITGITVLSF